MQDEYVCGSDYENSLDPTGKYIVNGEIVVGGRPGLAGGEYQTSGKAYDGLYSVWDYDTSKNVWGNGNISTFVNDSMYKTTSEFTGATADLNMAQYLQRKIGYIDGNGIAQGMCASVLNKCQNYTYGGKGASQKYDPNNQVVREYLERAMIQIKASQDAALADYAEDCISDVAVCLSQNNRTNYTGTYNALYGQNDNYSNVAIRACMSQINTCRSVTQSHAQLENDVYTWLDEAIGTAYQCTQNGGTPKNGYCELSYGKTTYFININSGVMYTDADGKVPVGVASCPDKISSASGNVCIINWGKFSQDDVPTFSQQDVDALKNALGYGYKVSLAQDKKSIYIYHEEYYIVYNYGIEGGIVKAEFVPAEAAGITEDNLEPRAAVLRYSAVSTDDCTVESTADECKIKRVMNS